MSLTDDCRLCQVTIRPLCGCIINNNIDKPHTIRFADEQKQKVKNLYIYQHHYLADYGMNDKIKKHRSYSALRMTNAYDTIC